MKKIRTFLVLCIGVFLLNACGSVTKESLGLSKSAPDEFMVSPRAPLSLPPEYDLLPVGMENYYNNDWDELSDADKGLLERISKEKGTDSLQAKADAELKKLKTNE